MANSLGEAMRKGGPVIFTSKDKDVVPQLLYTQGKEAEALKLLEIKGIIKLLQVTVMDRKEPVTAYDDGAHTWLTSAQTA